MFLKCLLLPQRKTCNENVFTSTKWAKTSAMHFIFTKWNMRKCSLLVSWGGKAKGQKQPFRGVLRKKCFENMQQIYKRTSMSKCDFNEVFCSLTEITLRHGCSPVNLLYIFRIPFPKNTSEQLLLKGDIFILAKWNNSDEYCLKWCIYKYMLLLQVIFHVILL